VILLPGAGAMKYLYLISGFLSLLLSNVYSLDLTTECDTTANTETLVGWIRQPSDPDPLVFDLRFVNSSGNDVGLAVANVTPPPDKSSGNLSVAFPTNGTYKLVAVTGPHYVQIGYSNSIQVVNTTSCKPALAGTNNPMSPQVSGTTQPPLPSGTGTISSAPQKRSVNVPAVVGGVIGAAAFIAIPFAVFLFIRRRRDIQGARISFHRDMMVRRSPDVPGPSILRSKGPGTTRYPFTTPRSGVGSISTDRPSSTDLEQGLGVSVPAERPTTPSLGSGHIVPPPRGPRDRKVKLEIKAVRSDSAVGDDGVPVTPRQRQVFDKMANVESEIEELEAQKRPGPSDIVKLDDLKRQRSWLVKQRNSMWALGELDAVPPGYSRYLSE